MIPVGRRVSSKCRRSLEGRGMKGKGMEFIIPLPLFIPLPLRNSQQRLQVGDERIHVLRAGVP